MASIANAVLDDDLIGDGDSAFIGGQVSATVENAIPKGSYCLGQNVDLDPFGRLTTRRGARTITGNVESRDWEDISANWEDITLLFGNTLGADAIDAAFYYDTYASEVAVIAQGGALKYGTEGGAYATIASATYSGADVYFAQLNNRLYFCDGVGALKYVDSSYAYSAISAGRVSSIRVTHPGSGYTSAPAITFSSGAGVATALLAYGGRVIGATIDTAGSGYSATTPPTISFAAPGSGGNTATGIVNITQLPAKPKYLVSHTNRLFAASADTAVPPDTVYASYFLDGEAWDLAGASIRVGGDGDPITGLFSWTGNLLLVLKQRSIWIVDTDPLVNPADWVQKQITGRVGCVSHRSVQPVGSDVFFLSQDGVRSLRQIESGTKTEVGQPLSAPIQDQIDRINKAALSKVCAAFYRNRYFLAVPQDGDTVPKTVLVWDELRKCWLGPWTGWQPRDFCVTGFSGRVRLNFADNTGKFWTWDDFTPVSTETSAQYQDDTSVYESYVISRAYDCGDPLVNKLGYMLNVVSENRLTDAPVTAYLSYATDISGSYTSLDSAITMSAGDRQKRRSINMLSKGRFNVIQIKFGALQWKMSVASIAITAFADPIQTEVNT